MRFSLLAALAVAAAVPAVAQPVVGVRASGVYSTAFVSSSDFASGGTFGLGVGAFVEVPVTPILSVVADLGYVQGGAVDETFRTTTDSPEIDLNDTVELRLRTHALTFAPALSATLQTEDIKPFLFLGPRLDVKLAERGELDGASSRSDNFPDAAIGFAGGAGVAAGRARLDVRGSYLWAVEGLIRQSAVELRLGVTL